MEAVFWLGPKGVITGLHREDDPVNMVSFFVLFYANFDVSYFKFMVKKKWFFFHLNLLLFCIETKSIL